MVAELPSAMTPTQSTRPTAHAISARPWPSRAISACASVRARMNAALPRNSSVRSRLPRLNLSPKRIWPTVGPMVAPATTPSTPTPTTIITSFLRPERKSACLPAPDSAASFGSSAAWMAWNSRIGMRAMKNPTMKSAAASRSRLALREHEHAEGGGVAEGLRGERPEEQQREVGRELRPLGVGPRLHQAVLAPHRHDAGEHRRDRQREAVPEQVVDPGGVHDDHRQDPEDALGARGSCRRARSARCPRACRA